jgi:SAM-dependent methyltransferase
VSAKDKLLRPELLDLICCPACGASLNITEAAWHDHELWGGVLVCTVNAHSYPVHKGIPYLYQDDESWRSKKVEAEGWVQLHKKNGIYFQGENAVDLRIPYYPEAPWTDIAPSFDLALDVLQLTGSETVLDLGAGRGWAAKYFAARGCRVVALDIVPDENVGLGRARTLMRHANVEFELVIGDGEKLPFLANRFDVVFCCGTLHHATDLNLLVENIHNILRPGGRLCAICEPCISIWRHEKRMLRTYAAEELALGIHETMPTLNDYLNALQLHQLSVVHALPGNLYNGRQTQTDWPDLARELGATWNGLQINRPIQSLQRSAKYVIRRLAAVANGSLAKDTSSRLANDDAAAQYSILTWCGGALFLLAEKEVTYEH